MDTQVKETFNYSIIIPHKNIPRLLLRCLNSIPKRDDVEVIVVDDNSDADTVAYLRKNIRQDNRIRLYFTNEGRGAGYARNIGMEHASGKWLLFADADDFFTPYISEAFDTYLDSPSDAILFKHDSCDSDTLKKDCYWGLYNDLLETPTCSNQKKLIRYCTPWGKFFKHDFITRYNILFDEVLYSNDCMFVCKVGVHANQITIDQNEALYVYTFRTGSLVTVKSKEAYRCRLDVSIRVKNYLHKHHISFSIGYDDILNARSFGRMEIMRTIYLLTCNHILYPPICQIIIIYA